MNTQESSLWHKRLQHPSFDSLFALSMSYGFELNKEIFECYDVCHWSKTNKEPFFN